MSWFNPFAKNKPDEVRKDETVNKLLADRIIFLGTPIDDTAAQTIVAQMLFLEYESSDDINFYINSPGGSITASFAVYDTIKSIKLDATTVCLGQAGGTAAILLAAGAKGKRFIQPSSRIVVYKPQLIQHQNQDPVTAQKELERMKELVIKTLADETTLHPEQVIKLMRKDMILSANEAVDFGFADQIISSK